MLVEIFNDKKNKQFILSIGSIAKAYVCRAIWVDEDLYDYESIASSDTDFDTIYVEARLVKVSQNICVVESSVVEVVEDAEE
jgi:hypothetical protein